MKNEKGIFWAFELGIGLLILSSALQAQPITSYSHAPEMAFQLCLDLQEMWMQGAETHALTATFYPEKNIIISSTPSASATNHTAACRATRVRNGSIEKQFIAIEW